MNDNNMITAITSSILLVLTEMFWPPSSSIIWVLKQFYYDFTIKLQNYYDLC